jgi:hypothetical protein
VRGQGGDLILAYVTGLSVLAARTTLRRDIA